MEFPGQLTGPKFSDGDIINYIFDDVELTMRIPVVPYNTNSIDRVSEERDLRNIDTSDWTHFGDDGYCFKKMVVQNWNLEDKFSHDNIAHCLITTIFQKHSEAEAASLFSLNSKNFREQQLEWLKQDYTPTKHQGDPNWPCPENNFFAKTIERELVNGLLIKVEGVIGGGRKYPNLYAMIPLGKYFTMGIDFELLSLHYNDERVNPYSEELLEELQLKLFDDFLSHIQVKYNSETTAIIEKLEIELNDD